ncbi:porin [Alcanivorax sp. 1008]|uniref:porin n=1 Tax=Alcanivorax sp. 1008 TaxID=2816853 RepID=UPI001D9CAB38|nr:porin [Alcanivorax sp. 1008]MCC1495619.1 porin [Alcanivorax sp. 1008]
MNKKLLAIAVGAAVAFPAVALAEGPTVYGKMNITLEMNTVDPAPAAPDNDSAWVLDSNSSRLGVKGDYDLEVGGLSAIYQAEFGMNVDDGAGPFSQRNIFAGLKGGFGTIKAGKFDTPMKTSQGKVDQFNDLDGDISSFMTGDERANNIVQYTSPKLADAITINAAFIPNEDQSDFDGNGENENGLTDTISVSVVYETDSLYAALAQDIDNDYEGLDADPSVGPIDITRLTGAYKIDALELGAIYQMAEDTESNGKETSILVSGAFKMDRVKLKLQYGMTDGDQSDEELTSLSFGADYKLAKASKVFAYYTVNQADLADTEETFLAVGLEHKF